MAVDTDFWPLLVRVARVRWWLDDPQEVNQIAEGALLKASLGAALWAGEARLVPGYHAAQMAIEAKLMKLARPGEYFMAYDPRLPDVTVGGSPEIHTLHADNRRLRVSGLPAGYEVAGYIGWQYGTGTTRYALHRVETGATADANGLTPLFAVEPHIRLGATTGTPVTLNRPATKMMLLDSEYGSAAPLITEGATIRFKQVLR